MLSPHSLSLITLLKGVLYSHQKMAWENLLQYEAEVSNYFSTIGLTLCLEKRQLNFFTSLLCIVLRKYLLDRMRRPDLSGRLSPDRRLFSGPLPFCHRL